MWCSGCGRQLDDGSAFCFNCGAPVVRAASRAKTNPVVIIVVVAVVAVFGIVCIGGIGAAIVIPKLIAERTRSHEMVAIQNIRSIGVAQAQYFSHFGRYASSLSELALPSDGTAGTKGGYTYTLHGSPTGYAVNANPIKYGSTGRRTFFSDESLVIRVESGPEPATAESGEVK